MQRHVLSDFAKSEIDLVETMIDAVVEAMPMLIEGDDAGFMTKVALLCPTAKPAREGKKPKAQTPAETD